MPSGGFPPRPQQRTRRRWGPARIAVLGMVTSVGETGTKQVRIAISNGPLPGFCDAARTAMGLCFAHSAGAVYPTAPV